MVPQMCLLGTIQHARWWNSPCHIAQCLLACLLCLSGRVPQSDGLAYSDLAAANPQVGWSQPFSLF